MKKLLSLLAACLSISFAANAQMPEAPGQVQPGEKPVNEAYLFAHMTDDDYGSLYYSVSTNGIYWTQINNKKCVFKEYHGHADITKGHDGRYYLVGNRNDEAPDINFWVSTNLMDWEKFGDYTPDLKSIPNYPKVMQAIGAPKLFYDKSTEQYILTWHTTHDMGKTDIPEPYWAGQRTIYALSKDLKTFSEPPKKLFQWDMATIDVIVRKVGDTYFAILKDERYPTLDWTTGKTIRVCHSKNLTGPYSQPSQPISPNFREAPTLIPSPNGKVWYLYTEQYPGISYNLTVAEDLNGPWYQIAGSQRPDWDRFNVPKGLRHGSMHVITMEQYNQLLKRFPNK